MCMGNALANLTFEAPEDFMILLTNRNQNAYRTAVAYHKR